MEGEEQIDIDKINKERSMATVDEEEHAVLDRLTFDYHQKLQGKPQSHELVSRTNSLALWLVYNLENIFFVSLILFFDKLLVLRTP